MGPGLGKALTAGLAASGPIGAILAGQGPMGAPTTGTRQSPFLAALGALQGPAAGENASPSLNPFGVDPWENLRQTGPMARPADRPVGPQLQGPTDAPAAMLQGQPATPLASRGRVPASAPPTNRGGKDVASYAYNHYIQAGLSPAHAAGIVGNLGLESAGWDPNVISGKRRGDSGTAGYVGQWRFERLANLEKFAKDRGNSAPTLDDQLDFVLHEGTTGLDKGAARAHQLAQAAGSPEEAAEFYSKFYERPGVPHLERRKALAREAAGLGPSSYVPERGPGLQLPAYGSQAGPARGPEMASVGVSQLPPQQPTTTEIEPPRSIAGARADGGEQVQQPSPFDALLAQIAQTRNTTPLRTLDQSGKLQLIARLGAQRRSNFIAQI